MKRYVFLLPVLFLLTALPVHAQFSNGDVNIVISPTDPRPYQTITVTPDSSSIDLIRSVVTVSVDGKVVVKGSGAQSIPVTVAGPGGRTTISVSAVVDGKTYTKQLILRPADVALISEPVSTTHPLYPGASLTAVTGRVRIIAIPDLRSAPTARIPASALVYTWKVGDRILTAESGIGRSVLIATAPMRYRDAQISVTVSNADSTIIAQSATTVSPVDPVARIYHNDALMGPDFDHAISGTYAMTAQEDAFRAVGYFFGKNPSLAWTVSGQSASNDQDVTVRTTGTGKGNAILALTASQSDTHQNISMQIPIAFGANKTFNIFGF